MRTMKKELNREAFVNWGRKGGKKGGRSTSKAKSLAVRLNGQKGGRPKKVKP